MPSLTQLEYALAVEKHRHFGKAAKACNVSQPSLSMQLQKLEEELDVILFDRTRKPILPTAKGKQVIQQARIILQEYKRLLDISQSQKGEIQGEFKLAVIPTLSPYLLPLFLEKFCKSYPKVKLIIEEYKTEEIIELLKSDHIDAGLLVTPLHDDQIIERVLFYESFCLYASSNHPLLAKKQIKMQHLDTQDIWLMHEGHCLRNQVLNICHNAGQGGPIPQLNFESGSLETLKNMVQTIGGYTLLPYLATTKIDSNEKKNFLRSFASPVPSREVSLVHSRIFLKEDIITAMEKIILEALPSELNSKKKANISVIDIETKNV